MPPRPRAKLCAVGRALLTDFYELTMAASYRRRGMAAPATFSLFVRDLPPERGFLVAAGLEDCLDWLEEVSVDGEALGVLAEAGFDEESLAALDGLAFTGSVRAVPEGRVVFAGEPLLELTAPIAEAQLAETMLLNQLTFQTALASKAARCRIAAGNRIELVEFGFRRTHGVEAAVAAARAAALVGFVGTSNMEAVRRFGLHPSGTMAHSYVQAFPDESEAFHAFASDLPSRAVFLVDTYDTVGGIAHAIEVIQELGLGIGAGLRLDSGDLDALSRTAREMLDEAGLPAVRVFVSGGLDEHDIARLVAQDAPVDAAGVGTRYGVSADAPYLDSVYKLVVYDGRPTMKLSAGKETLPGPKQVFRGAGLTDHLGLAGEEPPAGTEGLLEPVMQDGRRVGGTRRELAAARARFELDLAALPETARRLEDPVAPAPAVTTALAALTAEVRAGRRPPPA